MRLDFYFHFGSPYAYLANRQLPGLRESHGAEVVYQPCDILAVMKSVGNVPSPACPPKARYAGIDAARWAALLGAPFAMNGAFMAAARAGQTDFNTLIRAALVARDRGQAEAFTTAVFDAMWGVPADLVSAEGRAAVLAKAGIADDGLWVEADGPERRAQLEAITPEAAGRGVFGVPTIFVGEEMFFGNDRMDFVRAALNGARQAGAAA
ncbi:2-hydroxychromene-2-carboxylate isomerase [Zavarzinia sp. CC-PAN008]|uniref:2-hydroxychromene-2-carboxylate isomerase n=1 Tax=Zavarzinia sp. CC-PAN008 TaxID=3243332 RepID=UPI003F744930